MVNPLVPTAYDVVWSVVAVAVIALTVAAFVSWVRTPGMSGLRSLGWLALIVLVPVIGPAVWFGFAPRRASRQKDA